SSVTQSPFDPQTVGSLVQSRVQRPLPMPDLDPTSSVGLTQTRPGTQSPLALQEAPRGSVPGRPPSIEPPPRPAAPPAPPLPPPPALLPPVPSFPPWPAAPPPPEVATTLVASPVPPAPYVTFDPPNPVSVPAARLTQRLDKHVRPATHALP